MKNHLPAKYTCPKCNKISNSKGYFCSFCGNKKEKPDSQFIEYDFDLFPKNTRSTTQNNQQSHKYVSKVIISFALTIVMGLGFYIPYTITKNISQTKPPEVFQVTLTTQPEYKTISLEHALNLKSTVLNQNKNAEFIENNFDIYYESAELYNINKYFQDLMPALVNKALEMPIETIISQTEGNIVFALQGENYIIVMKFKNREYVYSLEKILENTDYKSTVIDDYLLISNNASYLDRNVESYKGSIKNLTSSGYFVDTVKSLPDKGEAFIFIKTKKGVEFFEKTTKITSPSDNLPIGIIIEGDKLKYIDFTF